jgi:hypothetical protein
LGRQNRAESLGFTELGTLLRPFSGIPPPRPWKSVATASFNSLTLATFTTFHVGSRGFNEFHQPTATNFSY